MTDTDAWSAFGSWRSRLPMSADGVRISILPTPETHLLQADPADAVWRRDIAAVLGATAPDRVGGSADVGACRMLCLGPDMWLLLGPVPPSLPDVVARHGHAGLVETTETRRWLRLEGEGAAAALARLSTLDLSVDAFPPGAAFGARLGPLAGLIDRIDVHVFHLAGPTSTADYMAEMVLAAIGGRIDVE